MTKATLVFFLTLVKMFLVNFTKHDIAFWTKMEIFCHDKEVFVYSHCFVLFYNIRHGCWICQMTFQHPPWWAYGFHVWLSLYDTVYSYTSWDWTILAFWNKGACLIMMCCSFKVLLGFSLLIFSVEIFVLILIRKTDLWFDLYSIFWGLSINVIMLFSLKSIYTVFIFYKYKLNYMHH